jgi:hypothetical protein
VRFARETHDGLNPQPNPQYAMSSKISAYFGSRRRRPSCSKTECARLSGQKDVEVLEVSMEVPLRVLF